MKELYVNAPAKINLALKVDGLRDDGYHEIKTIFQSISLADRIKLKKRSGGIVVKNSKVELPTDEENLAYQAAEIFFAENNVDGGVEVYIQKNIPIAAGLAGGSTDAAAVLRALYDLYELEYNYSKLRSLLVEIGSDVPFCLEGGTVYAQGRGEILEFLPFIGEKDLLIVTPQLCISTPKIYSLYDKMKGNNTFNFEKLLKNIKKDENINWNLDYKNDLEAPAKKICQDIKDVKNIIKKTAAEFYLMSGSGPTVFAVYNNRSAAEKVAARWPRKNDFVTVVKTIDRY
ncbi:4-(cytidine 5'-diphospho)-2-C-methyl-D-erythritol kinase [Halanaerobium hydrogeniformans]|uniref:4-diphosphocytidyl-2-C-methyl-D-erythritol kinase n=1 Tax=Halanaerobium hydrogeniformans TaxID=656519 RepID=E4RJK0_HALHG|nr:4-(cytidine 5'-diphospho)-2-C-methyl-D-erythritol kinase [Halanaerobium hydrogeniformans]ADQ15420.1 4-diphosphocytidyl-2C-methyl-D-erythritol kinase [Halanaerobium hydrogeniformans]